jgi:inorganic pyrophosphatase
MITGVIEITKGTNKKLECFKEMEGNPIMQDYTKKRESSEHRVYTKPPEFNYGFLPRTWCDDELGGDGDAIDLVDLSWKELKPVLAVSDYLVLGIMGLVDQGELDYKVIAIEVNEAKERGIRDLEDFNK